MALAFDTSGLAANSTTPTSVNITAGASGGLAVLMVVGEGGSTITTIQVGGSNATFVRSRAADGGRTMYIYYFVNPPTSSTAYTIVHSGGQHMELGVIILSGAKQSAQPDSSNDSTTSGNLTLTDTTVADNCWLVSFSRNDNTGTPTGAGAGTTIRQMGNTAYYGDSNGAKSPAGSYSMVWNNGGTSYGAIVGIAPSVAAGPTNVKTWDGVTQSTGIKTYQGVALASVKSVNGVT